MRAIRTLAALCVLLALSAVPALAGPDSKTLAGFEAEAFRKNFAEGLAGRPNAPALRAENVRVLSAEPAATFGGTEIFIVRGELAPEGGQAQPFLLFVSADGQYYISDIVDMRAGRSILKPARERMRAGEVKTLGHTILKGQAGKPVVTYISDPFCPYCRQGLAYLLAHKDALSELKLAHYPLPGHPGADIACALMAWAETNAPKKALDFVRFAYADLKAPKVEERTQEALEAAWNEVAAAFLARFPELKKLGKTGPEIVKALGGSKPAKAVAEDMAKAAGLDVSGTPVIYVGQTRVEGLDEERLAELLNIAEK